jgi:cell division protein FtsZ
MIIAVGCAGGRIAGKLGLPFAAVNTDQEELGRCLASTKLQIGQKWSLGYGVCVPNVGAMAALEARIEIGKLCRGPVILVAALGAGTGGGAGPVVARIAKAHGCEVTAVVAMPFRFEGQRRNQNARESLVKFDVDRLVTVRLDDLLPKRDISLRAAFEIADVEVARVVEQLVMTPGPGNSEVVDVAAVQEE